MATKTFNVTKQMMADKNGGSANPGDKHIPLGVWPSLGWVTRALLYAPISFSGMTAINSARLYFYVHAADGTGHVNGSGTVTLDTRRKTSDWSESSAGTSTSVDESWGGSGASLVAGGFVDSGDAGGNVNADAADGTLVYIDITESVKDWFGGSPNYGLMVWATGESSTADAFEAYSRHQSGKVPYIYIDYDTNTAPNAPTNLQPTGDAVRNTGSSVTLTGTRSDPDSGDYIGQYRVQVYSDDLGTVYADDYVNPTGTPTTFSHTVTGLPTGVFLQWRARTSDKESVWGPYSGWQRFKLNSTPNVPTLALTESPSTDIKTLTPTFKVTHSDPDAGDTKAYKYQILLLDSDTASIIWDSGEVTLGTPITTVSRVYDGPSLAWGTRYLWTARTQDAHGQWSAYPAVADFTTHEAGVPVSLTPSGVTVGGITPTFAGSRASSADSLTSAEVQVYSNDGVTLIWDSGDLSSGVTSTGFTRMYSGTSLSYSTSYKWRARVTSSVGGTSEWSSLQSFTTPAEGDLLGTDPIGSGITDLTPDFQFSRTTAFNAYQIVLYEDDGTTVVWDSGTVGMSSATSKSVTYPGTPSLDWSTTYKWKVRVSGDGGSDWGSGYTDLFTFSTEEAGVPTLTSPDDNEWLSSSPTFTGDTAGGETIDTFRVIVYASDQTTVIWDSGEIAGSGTSFSQAYGGSALTGGTTYYWTARYTETAGPTGGYAPLRAFRLNGAPTAPTFRSPATGEVVNTLTPPFKARFSDPDLTGYGDTPSLYEVEVYRNSDSVLMHSLSDSTDLVAGENSVTRAAEGTALSYEVEYKWRARYTDSKGAVGAWSSYSVFKPSEPPVVAITAPGASINSPAFTVSWTFTSPSSKAQGGYRVIVVRDSDDVTVFDSGDQVGTDTSYAVPGGYLVNSTGYTVYVQAFDVDGLYAVDDTQSFTTDWAAPDSPAEFSVSALEETSEMLLVWEVSNLSSSDFSYYQIYRREQGDAEWVKYDRVTNQSVTEYSDYFAGHGVTYEYKVTVWKKVVGDVDVESPDSAIPYAILDPDAWYVVGRDRDPSHTFELPVYDETHTEPIQQEVFEPLGSRRKTIVRGKVLGAEGSLQVQWTDSERATAKRQLRYLADNAGPHILKSPFGDVWLVEFAGPAKKYTGGGHYGVTLTWIEVV